MSEKVLIEAANISQQSLSLPLVEKRLQIDDEVVLWEFDNFNSFTSSIDGLNMDPPLSSHYEWSKRISEKTQINIHYVKDALDAFQELYVN